MKICMSDELPLEIANLQKSKYSPIYQNFIKDKRKVMTIVCDSFREANSFCVSVKNFSDKHKLGWVVKSRMKTIYVVKAKQMAPEVVNG